MALGGRIAEEIVFGQLTTGASDDFKKATQLARSMVTEWGMSEKLGPLAYVEKEDSGFLGSNHHKDYSEETAKEIDDEVRTIIREQYARRRAPCWRPTATSSRPLPRRCWSARRWTAKRSRP
jgi:cell division protease FtsH